MASKIVTELQMAIFISVENGRQAGKTGDEFSVVGEGGDCCSDVGSCGKPLVRRKAATMSEAKHKISIRLVCAQESPEESRGRNPYKM